MTDVEEPTVRALVRFHYSSTTATTHYGGRLLCSALGVCLAMERALEMSFLGSALGFFAEYLLERHHTTGHT